MSTDLKNIPLQNTFRTTLTQKLTADVTSLTLYCADVPLATIPSGQKIRVTINARKGFTYQEDVMITSIDTALKTMTIALVADRGLARYAGDAGGLKEHPVLSEVIISDPYGLWVEIQNAVTAKVDKAGGTMTGALSFSGTAQAGIQPITLTTTQRNALGFVGSETAVIKNSTTGEYEAHYGGGSWLALSAGSTQPNMTTLIAGKGQLSSQADFDLGTALGTTGASNIPAADVIQAGIQKGSQSFGTTAGGTTVYTLALVPALTAYITGMRIWVKMNATNTGPSTINVNALGAKSIKKNVSQDVAASDLLIGAVIILKYDGTNFQVESDFVNNVDFGNGIDGDVDINSGAFSSGPISGNTLSRDAYFNNLTLSGGNLLKNGYRLFVKGTLTRNSTYKIYNNGFAGGAGANGLAGQAGSGRPDTVGGTAGPAAGAGTLLSGPAGKAGGAGGGSGATNGSPGQAGTAGIAGSNSTYALGSNGVAGGRGGTGDSGGANGAGGVGGSASAANSLPVTVVNAEMMAEISAGAVHGYTVAAGSGSGGGGGGGKNGTVSGGENYSPSAGAGGGSGSTGGILDVFARNIVDNGSGTMFEAIGGVGGAGGAGQNGGNGATASGGGGGGGGGNGGVVTVVRTNKTGACTVSVAGGIGGVAGASGVGAQAAVAGTDGAAGVSYEIIV